MSKTIEDNVGVGRREKRIERKPLPTDEEIKQRLCKIPTLSYCKDYYEKECRGPCGYVERMKGEG